MKKQFIFILFILILAHAGVCVQTNIYQDKAFTGGKCINTKINPVGDEHRSPLLTLNRGERTGEYISKPIKASFNFNEAIISWNCKTGADSGIAVYLRAAKKGRWTNWYLMGDWNYTNIKEKIKKDAYGYVNEDTLKLKSAYDSVQYRIIFFSKDSLKSPSAKTPSVRLVTICYANIEKGDGSIFQGKIEPSPFSAKFDKQLSVPYRSQCVEDSSISGKICGPTSLSMILEYYKITLPTAQVASFCYDKYNDIYGNWPYIIAFASEQGLTCWVRYFTSLDELKEEIKNNHPVIVGISFGEGELTGSPVASTAGHLLVVRGFDNEGNVYVNDPAFKNQNKGIRVYDKDEFTRAWLDNHLGIALIFRKN